MTLFIEEILQAKVRLIHFLSCCSGRFFTYTSSIIRCSVESLQAANECHGTDMDSLKVLIEVSGRYESSKIFDDLIRRGWHLEMVIIGIESHLLVKR